MQVNSVRLKELRTARQWSQEQLSQLSGLNLRTIQRLESGAKISIESLRALAAVFEVPAESLLVGKHAAGQPAVNAVRDGVTRALDFSGTTTRANFWWFALAMMMVLAFARLLVQAVGPLPLQIAGLLVFLPWVSACSRRLRDAGLGPWWQLICLVPVAGILVLLYLLTFPSRPSQPIQSCRAEDPKAMGTAA